MGEVIHRIDAPLVERSMMGRFANSVDERVAHQDILVRHINLCSQHAGALLEIAFAHPGEECPVLSRSSLTVRAINAQPMIVSAVLSDFFGALTVDVGQASIDQFEGELVKLLEVV